MPKAWPCGHRTADTVSKHQCIEAGKVYVREEHDPHAYSARRTGLGERIRHAWAVLRGSG